MGLLDRIVKAFRGEESDVPIVTKSMGWNWFEARDKLAELQGNSYAGLTPKMSTQKAFRLYRSWVFACCDAIQRKFTSVPFYLKREKGRPDDEEYDRIFIHPLLRLIRKPNKFMSGRQLMRVIQGNLDIAGMAFMLILYNGFRVPQELHHLSPTWLTNIIRGETTDDLIRGFSFAPPYARQMARDYSYAEIVYFHYPDLEDPVMPKSPLESLSHVLDIDLLLQVYEKDFFNNNARPDGILRTPDGMSDTEVKKTQERWKARHQGATRQHRIAILTNNLEYQPVGMSAKDFEFPALSEYVKDQVLATYGVPEAELGLFESFNKASSITSGTKFVENCIEPRMSVWEDVIDSQLLPHYADSEGFEFKFESALPKDEEWTTTKRQVNLSTGFTSVNEERKREGLKPWESPLFDVPWTITGEPLRGENDEADKLWDEKMEKMMGGGMAGGVPAEGETGLPALPTAQGPMGVMGGRPEGQALSTLLTSASRRTNAPLATLLNAARGRRGGLAALLRNHPEEVELMSLLDKNRTDQSFSKLLGMASKGFEPAVSQEELAFRETIKNYIESKLDDEDKLVFRHYESAIAEIEPLEEEYLEECREFYIEKARSISSIAEKMIGDFQTKGDMADNDMGNLKEAHKRLSEPYIVKGVEIGHRLGVALVEKTTGKKFNSVAEEYAVRAAGKLLERSSDLKTETTRKTITEIIQDGIERGWSTDRVADEIHERLSSISGPRAHMIARTELSAAVTEGAKASFRQINKDVGALIVREGLVWASLDERLCEICRDAHGKVAVSFVKGTEDIEVPLHPNCRCVLKPVISGG